MQTVQGVRSWHGSVLTKCKCMASSTCVFTCCSWQDHRLLFHTGGLFWLLCLLWCSQCSLREFRGTSWNSNITVPCLTFFHVSMFFPFWQKEFSSVVSFACLFFFAAVNRRAFFARAKNAESISALLRRWFDWKWRIGTRNQRKKQIQTYPFIRWSLSVELFHGSFRSFLPHRKAFGICKNWAESAPVRCFGFSWATWQRLRSTHCRGL